MKNPNFNIVEFKKKLGIDHESLLKKGFYKKFDYSNIDDEKWYYACCQGMQGSEVKRRNLDPETIITYAEYKRRQEEFQKQINQRKNMLEKDEF